MKTSGLLLSLLIFVNVSLTAAHPSHSPIFEILDIVSLEKIPIVKCQINGIEAFFVLDSGSDVSLLHSLYADQYDFSFKKKAHKSIVGLSGGSQSLHIVPEVKLIANTTQFETDYYTTDLSTIVESLEKSTGFTISGIIGMDIMRKYGFTIDYASKTARFEQS